MIELRRVLQMIKSAHCTTTMETKKAVWQVYSMSLRDLYVYGRGNGISLRSLTNALSTYPFLTIGIGEVVNTLRVPFLSQAKQKVGPETTLCHDDKVSEETSGRLDHTNLTIGHGDESLVDQFVLPRVSWLSLHDVTLGLFVSQRDGGHHVCAQIDAQYRYGAQRQRHVEYDEEQEW